MSGTEIEMELSQSDDLQVPLIPHQESQESQSSSETLPDSSYAPPVSPTSPRYTEVPKSKHQELSLYLPEKVHLHDHHFTPHHFTQLKELNSLNYSTHHSRINRARKVAKFAENEKKKHSQKTPVFDYSDCWRWVITAFVGILTGMVSFLMRYAVESLSEAKFELLHEAIASEGTQKTSAEDTATAGILFIVSSVFLGLIAAIIIQFISKAAGGSGIPDVIAYLNGIRIPKVLGLKTFIANIGSAIFAVSSGIVCGVEGPSIQTGAIIGAGIPQFKSSSLNFKFSAAPGTNSNLGQDPRNPNSQFSQFQREIKQSFFDLFRNDKDKRDFISIGAASGIAAAFKSPIGGTLFALEEACSFWSTALIWRTLFGSMTATFIVITLETLFKSDPGSLIQIDSTEAGGLFAQEVGNGFYLAEMFLFIFIGIIGGALGAVFTNLSLRISSFRRKIYGVEPIAQGEMGDFQLSIRRFCLKNPRLSKILDVCFVALLTSLISFVISIPFPCVKLPSIHNVNEERFIRFTCPEGFYNEYASLFINNPELAVQNLLDRSIANDFSIISLFCVSLSSFLGAALVPGLSISAGLIVPLLLIGGSFGRMFGVVFNSFNSLLTPGLYALIGCAAFIGGVSRITVAFTVVLLELTADLQFLLPIMVATMTGKFVADLLDAHTLYHGLLHNRHIPFLAEDPPKSCIGLTCEHIMSKHVTMFESKPKVEHVIHILSDTQHHGFPIVETSVKTRTDGTTKTIHHLKGIIRRRDLLLMLLHRIFINSPSESWIPPTTPVNGRSNDPQANIPRIPFLAAMEETTLKIPKIESAILTLDDSDYDLYLDLLPVMNYSPNVVEIHSTAETAYRMYRGLGLRHIVVLDDDHSVAGIISRYNLLEENINKLITKGEHDSFDHHV